jgi:transcriptional regulator with XRE-family HTH domain
MNETTGMRVRKLRKTLKMSQRQLAEATGCSLNNISLIENDHPKASRFLPSIAKALHTTTEYLVDGDQVSEPRSSYRACIARIDELAETGRITLPQIQSLAGMAEAMAAH